MTLKSPYHVKYRLGYRFMGPGCDFGYPKAACPIGAKHTPYTFFNIHTNDFIPTLIVAAFHCFAKRILEGKSSDEFSKNILQRDVNFSQWSIFSSNLHSTLSVELWLKLEMW